MMQVSNNLITLVKVSEGLRLTRYTDAAGHASIGYGHKLSAAESDLQSISLETAEELLSQDLSSTERLVWGLVADMSPSPTQDQFDALVDFTFNLGIKRLASSTLLALFKAGDIKAAADEFLKWDHDGGVVLPGLAARRASERALFLS